jgi:hypothetical protein
MLGAAVAGVDGEGGGEDDGEDDDEGRGEARGETRGTSTNMSRGSVDGAVVGTMRGPSVGTHVSTSSNGSTSTFKGPWMIGITCEAWGGCNGAGCKEGVGARRGWVQGGGGCKDGMGWVQWRGCVGARMGWVQWRGCVGARHHESSTCCAMLCACPVNLVRYMLGFLAIGHHTKHHVRHPRGHAGPSQKGKHGVLHGVAVLQIVSPNHNLDQH